MRVLRWILITGPARACVRRQEAGYHFPWLYVIAFVGLMAMGAVVGVLVGFLVDDLSGGLNAGIGISGALVGAWLTYGFLFGVVMRRRNRPLETVVGAGWMDRARRWYDGL